MSEWKQVESRTGRLTLHRRLKVALGVLRGDYFVISVWLRHENGIMYYDDIQLDLKRSER